MGKTTYKISATKDGICLYQDDTLITCGIECVSVIMYERFKNTLLAIEDGTIKDGFQIIVEKIVN